METEIDENIEDDDYIEAIDELKQQCDKKKKGNVVKIKELMEKTYIGRWKWILNDRPLVTHTFPPLNTVKAVSSLEMVLMNTVKAVSSFDRNGSNNIILHFFIHYLSSVMSLEPI